MFVNIAGPKLFLMANQKKMKTITIIAALIFAVLVNINAQNKEMNNLHDFKVTAIDGSEYDLAQLKGKKVLVVNTASKCGYTPQYEDLQKLYETYGGDDFTIIGFPANNFMGQEPGTNDEIRDFCRINYGVTFPMMAKISVKGKDMHPLYEWLTEAEKNGKMDSKVKWNFQKYFIDENGNLVDFATPGVKPFDEKITEWIKS
jgi:glutathione peroxidase